MEPMRRNRKLRVCVGLGFVCVGLIIMGAFAFYRPHLFIFYSVVTPRNSSVSGTVFKSGDELFWVQLASGANLTVQRKPLRVWCSPLFQPQGFRFGHYLLLPDAVLYGADLAVNDSFDRQTPEDKDGLIFVKDPMQRGGQGSFSFPRSLIFSPTPTRGFTLEPTNSNQHDRHRRSERDVDRYLMHQ
jgi:hypothetical protein